VQIINALMQKQDQKIAAFGGSYTGSRPYNIFWLGTNFVGAAEGCDLLI
jgi:hypothetical protein